MSVGKPWSFGSEHGFTGSAKSDGKTPVRAHERSCYAKGGHVKSEGKNTLPSGKTQKHYDRMENFRKEQDAEPASPASETDKMSKGGKWIAGAIKKPGALRKELGVKKGEKIPAKKLAMAAKKGGKEGKRARLAQTMKKFAEGGEVANSVSRALSKDSKLNRPGGEGTKNVVGFKKGGHAKGKSGAAQKAAGALAQIAAMASQGAPGGAPMAGSPIAGPGGPPMPGPMPSPMGKPPMPMPPGAGPGGPPMGLKAGGRSKKK